MGEAGEREGRVLAWDIVNVSICAREYCFIGGCAKHVNSLEIQYDIIVLDFSKLYHCVVSGETTLSSLPSRDFTALSSN